MDLKDVIKKPIITEKSTGATNLGRYTFEVARKANKNEIAQAVGKFFDVHVKRVWTAVMPNKGRQTAKRKKAIVQLAKGEKIDVFETGE